MSHQAFKLSDVIAAPTAAPSPISSPCMEMNINSLADALFPKRIHAKQSDPAKRRRRSDQVPGALSGEQVLAWRKQLGITLTTAIKLLGMSKSAYIEMERNGTAVKRTVLAMRAIKHGIHLLPLQKYEQLIDSEGESHG